MGGAQRAIYCTNLVLAFLWRLGRLSQWISLPCRRRDFLNSHLIPPSTSRSHSSVVPLVLGQKVFLYRVSTIALILMIEEISDFVRHLANDTFAQSIAVWHAGDALLPLIYCYLAVTSKAMRNATSPQRSLLLYNARKRLNRLHQDVDTRSCFGAVGLR